MSASPIRVTVWGENVHEQRDASVKEIYPDGMHAAIAGGIRANLGDGAVVRTATLQEPQHGLTDEVLAAVEDTSFSGLNVWNFTASALAFAATSMSS